MHRELTESLDMAQSTVMRLQCVARDSRARKVTVAPSYVGRYSLALWFDETESEVRVRVRVSSP